MLKSLQPSSHVIFLLLVLLGNYDSLPRILIHTLGVCNCKFILLGYISEAILDFTTFVHVGYQKSCLNQPHLEDVEELASVFGNLKTYTDRKK